MNSTPRGNRLHIAIFGRRNAGKSSLINALTNQDIAVVSDYAGTTTDPVYKSMEILPIGPVVIIDTAGIDDVGPLGELRVEKSKGVLKKADMVLLVIDAGEGLSKYELDLIEECKKRKLAVLAVINKIDLRQVSKTEIEDYKNKLSVPVVAVSALTGQGMADLKISIIRNAPTGWDDQTIIGDLLQPGDVVVLVVPIDLAAPKGRLILPQVQTIRDILDHDAIAVVAKERELKQTIDNLACKPKMVVTDSQAFLKADADTPPGVLLTSFSILFARYKGDLETLVAGAKAIERLQPGDKVLIAESCTHHRVEDDIGTVKIPRWMRQFVGGELHFDWVSGTKFPDNLREYKLVVHCGACMINRREMLSRIMQVREAGVPIVNYGVAIAHLHGILRRALSPFPHLVEILDQD
ncbi:[FeFe] hydrogenase H-cluster maturation GTPase HydF [Desulfohalotomaculum tongense]|uniref:[FeFe] hydrogenase H-cluster maturation GTPase HydF n=1 Tax=Desulforadius tongensis TaxID=1216062 RepID=UPI0019598ABC|nr:[FeFe] hydrogenase H-cluster maturation GTPase HydF [Desulforadius tongensis]MBM7855561.1 [FeFe] hydrogenase H-cluster maturation GTPase HydF [Desulforadius tongensis]